jgi:hypothetical protein
MMGPGRLCKSRSLDDFAKDDPLMTLALERLCKSDLARFVKKSRYYYTCDFLFILIINKNKIERLCDLFPIIYILCEYQMRIKYQWSSVVYWMRYLIYPIIINLTSRFRLRYDYKLSDASSTVKFI